jgi:hypothetical protein
MARPGATSAPGLLSPKNTRYLDLPPRTENTRTTITTTIMSGAVAQARRRSANTNGNGIQETVIRDEGWCVSVEVTEEEIIDCLKSHTCYGSKEEKTSLLRKLIEHRPQLLARFKTLCSHLEQSFDLNMPSKTSDVNKLSVSDIVKKLFQAKVMLDEYLQAEVVKTRLVITLEYLQMEINKMRKEAEDTLKQKKEDSLQNQILKLGLIQKNRKFLENGSIPADESHRTCPFCKHSNVDEPSSNVSLLEKNLVGLSEFNW